MYEEDEPFSLAELAEISLYEFFKQAWEQIEGSTVFKDGYHIEMICEHLEALQNRQIKNLLINIPPRTSKTSLISIAFPAWVWTHSPHEKFMYASYAQSLSLKHSVDCRRLIQSPWYQGFFKHSFKLMKDQNTKGRFDNDKRGYRISTSVNGSVTGEGASILICFPYETLIKTSVGNIEIGKIVENKIDCEILSFNHKTLTFEYKPILTYFKNKTDYLLRIELEDGTILECTENHPVYIEGKGYIEAKNLCENDVCLKF